MAEPGAIPEVHDLLIDQRRRSQRGESFHAEFYLEQRPGLADDPERLLDLIYNELVLREQRGESPTMAEYQARFPHLAEALGDLFAVHRAMELSPEAASAASLERTCVPALEPTWPSLPGYELVNVLGSGGMGIVYRARDLKRGLTVAVKTMWQADAGAIYRFKQEFRALLDVSHPNLVTLHELISDGVGWYIVMEYIDGVTFLEYLRLRPARGDEPASLPETERASSADDGRPMTTRGADRRLVDGRI